jgi:hypothetical protein
MGKINEILPRKERKKWCEDYIAIRKRPQEDGYKKQDKKLYGGMYE